MSSIFHRISIGLAIAALAAVPGFGQTIHVPSQATLQNAIDTVADGGVIEIAAGTYPATSGGFLIANPARRFTIRAAGNVVLDGGGTSKVLWYTAASAATRGAVVFEGLTFRNGLSSVTGQAGGVTLTDAEATFIDCRFENNTHDGNNGHGGGVGVYDGSTALFVGSVWQGNSARGASAGLRVGTDSEVWVHDSRFVGNRVNLPDHRPSSTGGAISVVNGSLAVTNTRFEANQAGFAGGAIYALGDYVEPVSVPQADVLVANCTFDGNHAVPDASIATPSPSAGGAIHGENQTRIRIFNSRFYENTAALGGAVSGYRSTTEIEDGVLRGNLAFEADQEGGTGGTIKTSSNDTNNHTTDFGAINRPSATLTVTDSLIQGRFGGTGIAGLKGGCVSVAGDTNRTYGNNPDVPQMGGPAINRSLTVFDNVIFDDCDVDTVASVNGSGVAGAIQASHADLTIIDSLITRSDAFGSNGKGGGLRLVTESVATITGTTFAGNRADVWGGAIWAAGSELDVDDSNFLANQISPGASEPVEDSLGAAIYAAPSPNLFGSVDLEVTGTVRDSLFSGNVGLDVWDDDRAAGPINDLRYHNNRFYNTTFGGLVYRDKSAPPAVDVAGLNALVVTRNTGVPSTDKSPPNNNVALGSAPVAGQIVAAPSRILQTNANGDPAPPTEAFAAIAWSGGSATLDGGTVTTNPGLVAVGQGIHTLSVGGQDFLASIVAGAIPGATLIADPMAISGGQTSNLEWSSNGSFLAADVDRGVVIPSTPSGSVAVQPDNTTEYTLVVVAREGGATDAATVFVDEVAGLIFLDGFESGDTSEWSL